MNIKDLGIVTREISKAENISYTIFPGADKILKKNETLVDSADLFNNFKPSNEKLIHKFKGEREFLVLFNSE